MSAPSPLMIAVAPNGARKTKAEHSAIPITPAELASTAENCLQAGACMIHLHVRDKEQRHSLDPLLYKEAINAIRSRVGDSLIIQITTEAVGLYQPDEQIEVVKLVKPEAVSIALREFCPDESHEREAAKFFQWMHRENIAPQYILYDLNDLHQFEAFLQRGLVPGDHHTILLVLGRYTKNQQSDVDDLDPLLNAIPEKCNWWLCAFGKTESMCMQRVIELGGNCRVGFENNLHLPDGEFAPNNASLVEVISNNSKKLNRSVANADLARDLMYFR